MADINRVLYTAQEAILSNLTAINVTGSNISNVNTEGYTRVRPIFATMGTTDATSTEMQTGVRVANVEQIYDRFLEAQLVQQQAPVANYTAQQDYLQRVEAVLNESDSGGINDSFTKFLNAWGDLSADPSSKAKRDQVVSTGENLAYTFSQRASELTDIQTAANDSVADNVTKLNGYLTQMAEYNQTIVSAESAGNDASWVRDKRGALLKQIGGLIDINYIEKTDGSLYITLPQNGKALVEGFNSWDLNVQRNSSNNNMYDVVFKDNPTQAINDQISGGTLAGLLEVRDTKIPSYLNQLNQTASSIVNKVNEIHTSGYDQNGNAGESFFVLTGTDQYAEAKYMAVNDNIVADSRKIAASATVNADGNNASAITSISSDQMYASIGNIVTTGSLTSRQVINIGQIYKNATSAISLSYSSTTGLWTIGSDGGYSNLSVLASSGNRSIQLDFNNDGRADMTFSGTWANGDTMSFSLTKDTSTTSIDGYFNSFIANMGQDVGNVKQKLEAETTILNQQNDQREQLSGVSLDEEMMNLIKYQMAYGAAGKLTKIVSDMMDQLINLGQ